MGACGSKTVVEGETKNGEAVSESKEVSSNEDDGESNILALLGGVLEKESRGVASSVRGLKIDQTPEPEPMAASMEAAATSEPEPLLQTAAPTRKGAKVTISTQKPQVNDDQKYSSAAPLPVEDSAAYGDTTEVPESAPSTTEAIYSSPPAKLSSLPEISESNGNGVPATEKAQTKKKYGLSKINEMTDNAVPAKMPSPLGTSESSGNGTPVIDEPQPKGKYEGPKIFSEITDQEMKRYCTRIHKKLNHDPWDEFKKYDDDDVCDRIIAHPETCQVQYGFESFSGLIYPLSMLCSLGASKNAVQLAFEANVAALDECDLWVGTPLHYACSYKAKTEVVEFLIEKKPEALEITNHFGRTPLHMACLFKAPANNVSLLLQHYPEAAGIKDKDGYAPLHLACENTATPEVVLLLVNANPEAVSSTTGLEATPLHYACSHHAPKAVVQILLDANPEMITKMDLMGQTPLHLAALGGATTSVVALLVKANPDGVDAVNDRGETPLRIAKRKNVPVSVLKLLRGTSPNIQVQK